MGLYMFEGKSPRISSKAFVHPEAVIIGDVTVEENCYIGAGAVIRGDWGKVIVKKGSNIQENCIIHADVEKTAHLGFDSHIGHGAILHGPTLGEHVVVGMGAIIMDDAVIGAGCLIGAGALVTTGMKIPPQKKVLGVPAKVCGDVEEELAIKLRDGTRLYQQLAGRCLKNLKKM